jgi:SET domain-containing protein
LKPQTNWINANTMLNYVELKINLYYFSVDIWIDTIIALKQHKNKKRYINHFKVSNQHYLKINVDQNLKSIDSIDIKTALNQHFKINTILLFIL